MKEIITAVQQHEAIMQKRNCTREVMEFVRGINNAQICEWYYLCALDGMGLTELSQIDRIPVKDIAEKVAVIQQEREKFLRKLYQADSKLSERFDELHLRAETVFEESRQLRETLDKSVAQAMLAQQDAIRRQEKSMQLVINSKEEVIREKEKKILEMKVEIRAKEEELKKWKAKAEQNRDLPRTSKKKEEAAGGAAAFGGGQLDTHRQQEKKKLFWPFRSKENQSKDFIQKYLNNEKYSEEQRDYLVSCLESGDTLKEMEGYAFPGLSVEMMIRLRKLQKGN